VPRIMVISEARDGRDSTTLLEERVPVTSMESDYYSAALVERVGWAIVDADELERADPELPPAA
jgi:hypothetical protein